MLIRQVLVGLGLGRQAHASLRPGRRRASVVLGHGGAGISFSQAVAGSRSCFLNYLYNSRYRTPRNMALSTADLDLGELSVAHITEAIVVNMGHLQYSTNHLNY